MPSNAESRVFTELRTLPPGTLRFSDRLVTTAAFALEYAFRPVVPTPPGRPTEWHVESISGLNDRIFDKTPPRYLSTRELHVLEKDAKRPVLDKRLHATLLDTVVYLHCADYPGTVVGFVFASVNFGAAATLGVMGAGVLAVAGRFYPNSQNLADARAEFDKNLMSDRVTYFVRTTLDERHAKVLLKRVEDAVDLGPEVILGMVLDRAAAAG